MSARQSRKHPAPRARLLEILSYQVVASSYLRHRPARERWHHVVISGIARASKKIAAFGHLTRRGNHRHRCASVIAYGRMAHDGMRGLKPLHVRGGIGPEETAAVNINECPFMRSNCRAFDMPAGRQPAPAREGSLAPSVALSRHLRRRNHRRQHLSSAASARAPCPAAKIVEISAAARLYKSSSRRKEHHRPSMPRFYQHGLMAIEYSWFVNKRIVKIARGIKHHGAKYSACEILAEQASCVAAREAFLAALLAFAMICHRIIIIARTLGYLEKRGNKRAAASKATKMRPHQAHLAGM